MKTKKETCQDDSHPSQGVLVAFRDGELDPSGSRRIEKHLSQCWICSSHLRLLEERIEILISALETESPDVQIPPTDLELKRLQEAMASIRASRRTWRDALLGFHGKPVFVGLICGFVALLGFLVFSEFFVGKEVSAYDIAVKSIEAEQARLFVPGKIVHQLMVYQQEKGLLPKVLPDGRYRIERWWDNTSTRRGVYRMYNSRDELVEGHWTFPDGSSASFQKYGTEGPLLRQVPLGELIQNRQKLSPEQRELLKNASIVRRDLQLLERQHLENQRSFFEAIRTGHVSGRVTDVVIENKPGYLVSAEFSSDELGPHLWKGRILADDMRVVSAEISLLGANRSIMVWTESQIEVYPPNQIDPSVFEVGSLPEETRIQKLSAEETLKRLDENFKNYLRKRETILGKKADE